MSAFSPRTLRLQIVILLVAALALVTGLFATSGAEEDDWVTLVNADVLEFNEVLFFPEEMLKDKRVRFSRQFAVYLVHSPDGPVALNAYGGWRRERVTYCETSELFEASRSGSKFDKYGYNLYGAASMSIPRMPVRVVAGMVQIQPYERLPRFTRKESERYVLQPVGPYCIPH